MNPKKLNVIHECVSRGLQHPMAPLEEVVEAGAIQDFRRPVADFFHDETNATGRFVNTFIAPAICGLTDAWKQRDGSIQGPNDFSDGNQCRGLTEVISPSLSLLAVQDPFALQFQQDQLQKLVRYFFLAG